MGITGDWYSELGSHMRLVAGPDGALTGTYLSATGRASGTYPLVGRIDPPRESGHGTAVGWAVAWQNENSDAGSVTAWSGQYQESEVERISATWLLTRSAEAPDAWESTVVGHDLFTRRAPDPARLEELRRTARPLPHPVS
ncbi:avidin/streptavidin family protein [Kitasatospora sp. NPDC049285]|uniref:avidin/streptavidin family protein n=1 Tax=Kitasatospora sp. NPDC049285 TaxID=3157096 RepID=UPI00341D9197